MILSDLWPTFQGHDNIQRQITRLIVSRVWFTQQFHFQWPWVTLNLYFKGVIVDTLVVLCAQLTRDLFGIAKFLFYTPPAFYINVNFNSFDTGIHSATEMLPLKRGRGIAHRCNCPPPRLADMRFADAVFWGNIYLGGCGTERREILRDGRALELCPERGFWTCGGHIFTSLHTPDRKKRGGRLLGL